MANAVDVPPDFTGSTVTVPNVSRTNANGGSGYSLCASAG